VRLFKCKSKRQGFYQSGKTGNGQRICVVRERSVKNIIFEKSGKMILGHADCI